MSRKKVDRRRRRRRADARISGRIWLLIVFLMIALTIFGVWLYYRLYQDKIDHVQGDYEMTLERAYLTILVPDENGFLAEKVIDVPVDFTESGGNIFGLEEGTVFTPGCYTQAALVLANKDKTPFSYWIEIVFDKNTSEEFAKQLVLTIETGKGPVSGYLSEGMTIGSETEPMGTLSPNEVKEIVVKVEFVDSEENDLTQNAEVSFDLIVHTVTYTE